VRKSIALSAFALLAAPAGAESIAPPCSDFTTEKAGWTCFCGAHAPVGPVWGSGPYTGNSDLCTAARHAGVIGPEGGMVSVRTVAGQAGYQGSEANGVITRDRGSFPKSVSFHRNAAE